MKKRILSLLLILFCLAGLFLPANFIAAEEAKETELIHGFKLVREEELADISSVAYIYKHEKSGAELLWLKNDDPFKVFAAAFKTMMTSNSGAPHIVEHAVLGGSRKYKSDDIFTDMNSRSTNAFMNAMTYPDKTIFPVASRDPQDFFNLTDVYLDSVFFPMILENRRFFDREGWRYEIFDQEDDLTYNGVVYNEMTGAMSDPMRNFLFETLASIFPDTFYRYNSGGNPESIPELSYEEFVDFYSTYYAPENALLYFYGDIEIEKYLEHIDKEYLSHFDKSGREIVYEKQKPFSERQEHVAYYNLDADADEDKQTYMSLSYLTGDGGDPEDTFMNMVLSFVLFEATSAPVKQALLEAGIGSQSADFSLSFNQNTFGVAVLNANADQKDDFVKIVEDTIQEKVKEGLDKESILAIINILEMKYREAGATYGLKGMDYLNLILDSYNYGGDPLAYLKFSEIFDKLRAKLDTGEYEEYLQEKVLDNPSSSICVLEPLKGLSADYEQKTKEKLAEMKANLSEEELSELIEASIELRDKPAFDESEYNLPSLKLADIDTESTETPAEVEELDKYTLVAVPQVTGGINYVNLQFDLSVIDEADLPYVTLLTELLSEVDTENFSKGDLEKEMLMYTGGIGFDVSNSAHKDTGKLDSRFAVYSSATLENIDKTLELIEEVTLHSKFEDSKWIGEQITALRKNLELAASSNAINIGLLRVRAYFDPVMAYREKLSGLDFIRFIQELDDNFSDDPTPYLEKLDQVAKQLFNSPGLVVGLTCAEDDIADIQDSITAFVDRLPHEEQENAKFAVSPEKLNEGIAINSDSNYVTKSAKLSDYKDLDASKEVVTLVLDSLYLYPELRAKGGAYGAGSFVDNYGNFTVYSFSDPHIRETVEVFDNMGVFLSNLELSSEELEQIIIGYFKAYPTPGEVAASKAVYDYINGYTEEYYKQEAEAVRKTSLEDIKAYGDAVTSAMQEANNLIALGGRGKLEENKDLFDNLTAIIDNPVDIPDEPVPADPNDPVLGSWKLDRIEVEGESVDAASQGMNIEITFTEDGLVSSEVDGEESSSLWLHGEDSQYLIFEEGMVFPYLLENDELIQPIQESVAAIFVRVADTEAQTEATDDAEETATQEESEDAKAESEGNEDADTESENTADEAKETAGDVKVLATRPELDAKTAAYQLVATTEDGEQEFQELEFADFDAWLDAQELVLIDFWAPWCGPCMMASPVIDEMAAEYKDAAKFLKINVDLAAPEISAQFGVQGIPHFVLLSAGEVVETWTGAQEATFTEIADSIDSLK